MQKNSTAESGVQQNKLGRPPTLTQDQMQKCYTRTHKRAMQQDAYTGAFEEMVLNELKSASAKKGKNPDNVAPPSKSTILAIKKRCGIVKITTPGVHSNNRLKVRSPLLTLPLTCPLLGFQRCAQCHKLCRSDWRRVWKCWRRRHPTATRGHQQH